MFTWAGRAPGCSPVGYESFDCLRLISRDMDKASLGIKFQCRKPLSFPELYRCVFVGLIPLPHIFGKLR